MSLKTFFFVILLFVISGCSGNISSNGSSKPAYLRVSLTDAPLDDVKSIVVNISHMEFLLGEGGKEARVQFGKNKGQVNLLKYQKGILLPIADLEIPEGVSIKQIRLVLKEDGNYLERKDKTQCPLQTPSGQESGVKILVKEPLSFEGGYYYSMIIDFDAKKSVVFPGNGKCLLNPVLKLASVRQVDSDDYFSIDDGKLAPYDIQNDENNSDLVDGSDQNDEGIDGSGFDSGASEAPLIGIDDISMFF